MTKYQKSMLYFGFSEAMFFVSASTGSLLFMGLCLVNAIVAYRITEKFNPNK